MTPDEAVAVLATAAGYDERQPSKIQAQVWADALTEACITRAEAIAAVKAFYADRPDDRVRPGHLAPYVTQQRARRAALAAEEQRLALAATAHETRGNRRHWPEVDPDAEDDTCAACGRADNPLHIRQRTDTELLGLLAGLRRVLPDGHKGMRRQLAAWRGADPRDSAPSAQVDE